MDFALDWLANFAVNEPTQQEVKFALMETAKAERLCPQSWTPEQIQAGLEPHLKLDLCNLQDWALTEGNLHRALSSWCLRNHGRSKGARHLAIVFSDVF